MKEQQYPTCEVCQRKPATSFSWFRNYDDESGLGGEWKFTCACTSEVEDYYVEFERFFESPSETAEWLAHLSRKTWMDWEDFTRMMARFREAVRIEKAA